MFVTKQPRLWLRLDGLVLFLATVVAFVGTHQHWWVYLALMFLPDIFMLGYLKNTKIGAFFYNVGHSYFAPSLLILVGWNSDHPFTLAAGLIWLGHVGWDRFFGYGLKYDSDFKHTHLGDLNRPKPATK
ncbi:MAG: DUF4260 domain-containing protein [Actinomycetes bacterium]